MPLCSKRPAASRALLSITLCFAALALTAAAAASSTANQAPANKAPSSQTSPNQAPNAQAPNTTYAIPTPTPAAQLPVPQPRPAAAAQTDPARPAPALRPNPAEKRPSLTVDRDPIPSPDLDSAEPAAGAATGVVIGPATSAGDITKSRAGGYTLRRDVDEVVLNATVLDDKGHVITDLDKTDFKISEDGVPQTILSVLREDIPVSLGFLIDNSGSMRSKREAVNKAALDLVRASNAHDESFIVNFADEAFLDQDFTSDINKLRDGLARIDSKGGTALYDSVVAAADELSKDAKRTKQVILIITDGEDTASSLTLEQAIRRVQDLQGPVIYSIGILFDESGHESKRAHRALKLLSDETGGVAFFPKSLDQIDEITAEVAHDIRSQYTIGYKSTKPFSVPGYRIVKVEAKNKNYSKLFVRTKAGYFPKGDKSAPAAPKAGQ